MCREAGRLGATVLRQRLDDLARRGRLGDPARGGAGVAVPTAHEQDALRPPAVPPSSVRDWSPRSRRHRADPAGAGNPREPLGR
ncbi:hypothetical protein SUDANB140_00445 [Streptomyces sp. enrichment culture]